MAQHSYRFQPYFMGGAWWRVEISWRESSVDPHTFDDEWAAGIPEQSAGEFTYCSISKLSVKATSDNDIIGIDSCDITFGDHANIDAWLDYGNDSAELRLWWSADGSTNWFPIFWGTVDRESAEPETERVIGSTWIKTWSVTVYDCISDLNRRQIVDLALYGSITGYSLDVSSTGTHQIHWGNVTLLGQYAWINVGGTITPVPLQPYDSVVKITYYLIEAAKTIFKEHVEESPSNGCYLFHTTAGIVDTVVLGAFKANSAPLGAAVEAQFHEWYVPYPLFHTGDFGDEFENLGELVAEFATMIGCGVTTRHVLDPGGEWVRQLWYVPRHSVNMHTITPSGVLVKHGGPILRSYTRKVTVSTRYPGGAVPVADVTVGEEDRDVKVNVHLRTAGVINPWTKYGWDDASGDAMRNVVWQLLVIPDTGTRLQVANYARQASSYYPTSQYNVWSSEYWRAYNGLAHALANWLHENVYSSRVRISESYSRANASDGTDDHPGVWIPCAKIGDEEDTAGTYRLLEAELSPEDNTADIVKEKIS